MAVASPRSLVCHYNPTLVVAALVVSLLGAFTSTQLMSQARGARTLPGVLIWTVLGCLTFGFCATWCLHFLGMLSCEFDIPIGLNLPLTVLSAVLAVSFTFGALSLDLFQNYWRRRKVDIEGRPYIAEEHRGFDTVFRQSSEPLLRPSVELPKPRTRKHVTATTAVGPPQSTEFDHNRDGSSSTEFDRNRDGSSSTDALLAEIGAAHMASQRIEGSHMNEDLSHRMMLSFNNTKQADYDDAHSNDSHLTSESPARLLLDNTYLRPGTTGMNSSRFNSVNEPILNPPSNTLLFAAQAIINGLTIANITKGFVWSVALTNMHFMGVKALDIPGGFVALNIARVILCAMISWSVCCVGVILMAGMEVNIKQQVLFSVVAATGVAAVHFSGMYACSFYSTEAPSSKTGYPIELPIVITGVAVFTCMASTGLLAHSATVARNKLAEVLYTRRRLWAAIAQKENAEAAAAARSEFIASASHEIRTPLHQLQGYADLLSKSELSQEDRQLLRAIQHATRSLSMITSNVLDWSRLDKGEAICRPVAVDIRRACEAVVHVLPNSDDNIETELIVIVAPEVPSSVFIDETYLQRILMNLLSNSFKFTTSGYVMLLLRFKEGVLSVTVEDSGSGIPKFFLPQLFEPYKQVQARGAERGTGLGLSITKRLIQQMHGSIAVESKYQQDQDVGPAKSGSIFTLTIPLANPVQRSDVTFLNFVKPAQIAIMHDGKHRDMEGIITAWKSFGIDVMHTQVITDIYSNPDAIIWADIRFLQKHLDVYHNVLKQRQQLILVPYKDKILLDEILGPTPPSNILPIQKPLLWHRIIQTISDAEHGQNTPDLVADTKLTATTNVALHPTNGSKKHTINGSKKHITQARKRVVLLVEDNKINQALGTKMLKMLNHDVLLAEDGQEAIDIVKQHAHDIDAILMDQSMPRKDGITAIREIRELEAAGLLAKRQTLIAVTAAAGLESRKQFLEAGTDMFLSKPLSLVKLEQALSHYFNQ